MGHGDGTFETARSYSAGGFLTNSLTVADVTHYVVKDEYVRVQPSGLVAVGAGGTYAFTVWLQASSLGADIDGRGYSVTVSATNEAGKIGSASKTVVVRHDLSH